MILVNGVWKQNKTVPNVDGEEVSALVTVPIMDVPVGELICKWEELVNELSDKEAELLKLKEYIQSESFHIETTVDFKELYGKNNADVRKHHIKVELSDVFDNVQGLELSINWIKSYIPLLREVVRTKQNKSFRL